MRTVRLICRLILALVFIYAAIPKIMDPHAFAVAVFRYQLLPYPLINLMAIYLPWLELIAAVALFIPSLRQGANLILFILLAVFTVAIGSTIARGINIACGCFSVDPDAAHISWLNMLRNLGLILAAIGSWSRKNSG